MYGQRIATEQQPSDFVYLRKNEGPKNSSVRFISPYRPRSSVIRKAYSTRPQPVSLRSGSFARPKRHFRRARSFRLKSADFPNTDTFLWRHHQFL